MVDFEWKTRSVVHIMIYAMDFFHFFVTSLTRNPHPTAEMRIRPIEMGLIHVKSLEKFTTSFQKPHLKSMQKGVYFRSGFLVVFFYAEIFSMETHLSIP